MTTVERQTARLKDLGRIEALVSELDLLKSGLDAAPMWRPAAALGRQCAEAIRMIRAISARFERSLVVTVIGPSGSGKSTLVNALAGGAALSPMGRNRPTTEALVVFSSAGEDAAALAVELGGDSVRVATPAGAVLPRGLCLIDTPDTDSTALHRHIPALQRVVEQTDVLLCVFDAENPKRRDHADFLAPFVRRFDGQSLLAVLNKCDRLDEAELKSEILPDFLTYLQKGWEGSVEKALCVSGRRHLQAPDWDAAAGPRHGFDQFAELRESIFGLVEHGSRVIDRRIENARQLHAVALTEAGRELAADGEALAAAARTLAQAQAEAMAAAAASWRETGDTAGGGLSAAVYQCIAGRWFGPMGWLLAVWMRLMSIGSGIAAALRRVRPSAKMILKGRPDQDERPPGLATALRNYRLKLLTRWPETAELLVKGRFDPSVRALDAPRAAAGRVADELSRLWEGALDQEIERLGRRLAGLGLQVLMNGPVLGILGYVGWVTVKRFFSAEYLPGDYFLHAFWVIVIVLVLSFFALQFLIRLTASPERILAGALRRLQQEAAAFDGLADHPLRIQMENVLRMAAAAAGR
jgi:energy-coupling factor transporter ATP-binding protein EcfA2